ncbi:MAG: hypothetical protein WC375_00440 [Methanomassiliicoccales archaeon]|jgi:hypothetical protein
MSAIIAKKDEGMFNSLMESLSDVLSDIFDCYHFNRYSEESYKRAEKSSEDYFEAIKLIDDKEKIDFTNAMIDLLCKDYINEKEFFATVSKNVQCDLSEFIEGYSNYIEGLPEKERKAFFIGWMDHAKKDYEEIYTNLGNMMSNAEIESEYEKLLISQSIFCRLKINLSDCQRELKKKGTECDTIMPKLFQVTVAVVRVAAMAQGKIQLDDLYRTYSRLKGNEQLCVFLSDKPSETVE